MKLIGLVAVLTFPALCFAQKPLLERLMNVDDPAYNDALSEMQELPPKAKAKLSKELAGAMAKKKKPDERANAASALGDLCAAVPENSKVLMKGLKDKHKFVRQASISGLGRCETQDVSVVRSLAGALSDENQTVREMAKSKLESLGTPEAQAALKGAKK